MLVDSEGIRHLLIYNLSLVLQSHVGPHVYEYTHGGGGGGGIASPIWIAVVSDCIPPALLQYAVLNRLNVHNYTRNGIRGPGGLQTIQSWMGNTRTVRQHFGDEVAWFLQTALSGEAAAATTVAVASSPIRSNDDLVLERALARSLEAYAEDQGRRSPCVPPWVETLRRFPSEPAVPGVHPKCIVCLESRATVAFVDCGHQVMCDPCACTFWSQPGGPMRQCLICRKPIQNAPIHLFPSEPLQPIV
jgi:Zinc finger, C3HC4 type (RING finger)